jgi:hypothetical protein
MLQRVELRCNRLVLAGPQRLLELLFSVLMIFRSSKQFETEVGPCGFAFLRVGLCVCARARAWVGFVLALCVAHARARACLRARVIRFWRGADDTGRAVARQVGTLMTVSCLLVRLGPAPHRAESTPSAPAALRLIIG